MIKKSRLRRIAIWSFMLTLTLMIAPQTLAQSLPTPGDHNPTTSLPDMNSGNPPPYCDEWHAEYPAVVKVGAIYYAYYSGYGCKWQIYYATSSDGIHFDKQGAINISGDDWTTQRAFPFVLYSNGLFRLYYGGGYPYQVSYAESHDGVNFTAPPQPIVPPEANQWDDIETLRPSIVELDQPEDALEQKLGLTDAPDQLYLMYYNGFGDNQSAIGIAFSSDGLTWQRYAGNPVVTSTTGIYTSFAYKQGDTTYLYYHTGQDLYLMTSKDGLDFTSYSSDPILHHGADGAWNAGLVYGAFVRQADDGSYVMYFNGIPSQNAPYGMVGIATSPDLIHWTQNPSNPVITVANTPANFAAHANADGSITASWHDVITDSTSYRLSYGITSQTYSNTIDISDGDSFTFNPGGDGDYYLSLTANSDQQRSYPAEERIVHLPLAADAAPIADPAAQPAHILQASSISVMFSFAMPVLFLLAAVEVVLGWRWWAKRRARA